MMGISLKGNNVFSAMKFKTNYINRFYTSEEEYLKVSEGESPRTYMAESQNDSEAEGEAECQNDSEIENQSGSETECQNYLSDTVTDAQDVTNILKDIRINRLIIGNFNINSIPNKFDQLKAVIPGYIDILVLVETKVDVSFPEAQFIIEGYSIPYRFDRNRNGGGVMIYVREDIPSKKLKKHTFPDDIEGLFIEINLMKCKWLLLGSYHPPSQPDQYYFDNLGRALDIYNKFYDKSLLVGDFNAEETEPCLNSFLSEYNLTNIVKDKTCFKSIENPSCIDLVLTNNSHSFQHTQAICSGSSDYHKMVVTVLKNTFRNSKPKEIFYRTYKNFDNEKFKSDLRINLEDNSNSSDYSDFENIFLRTLELHAPFKKKVLRANHAEYMTKQLRKAIMRRSALENKFRKYKTEEHNKAYRKQKNYCSRLYKKERMKYYNNLQYWQ